MTYVENACNAQGRFLPVDDRTNYRGVRLCRNCFDDEETLDDVPDRYELCRTCSQCRTTIHRTAEDVDELLVTNISSDSGSTGPEAWKQIDDMEVEEFDDLVGGGGRA